MRFILTLLLSGVLLFGCGDTDPTSEGTAQKTCVGPDCCFTNGDCAEDEYCDGKGACDSEGSCKLHVNHPCPLEVDPVTGIPHAPVCGCDGITYQGRCQADTSGIRIGHDGVCEAASCFINDDCAEREYCAGEGECDSEGRCETILRLPCALPLDPETGEAAEPVCGCNGVAYQSACAAGGAGARLDDGGVCE